MTSQDASTLMREAHALKAAGRLEDAIVRYREALAVMPRSGIAEHNLAGPMPFTGEQSRLSFAFDLVPAPDASADD